MAETTGYYEVYKQGVQWRWRFKANNNEIIASGESYYNKPDCLVAIGLMKGSGSAPIREV